MNPFLLADWKPKPLFNMGQNPQLPSSASVQMPVAQKRGGFGGLLDNVVRGAAEPFSYLLNTAIVNPAKQEIARATGNKTAQRNAVNETRQELGGDLGGAAKKWAGNSIQALATGLAPNPASFKGAAALGAVNSGGMKLAEKDSNLVDILTNAAIGAGTGAGFKGVSAVGSKVTGKIGNAVSNKADNFATKQFGLTDSFLAKYKKKAGEDAAKVIGRYGLSTVDDIDREVSKQTAIFNHLVDRAEPVRKATLEKRLTAAADDLLTQAPTAQKKVGVQLVNEAKQLMSQFGDDIPAKELNVIKKQYDDLVNYSMQQADPATYGVNKRIADELREAIQDASGSKQLKGTGREISKLINLSDEAQKRAPAVSSRAASPLNLRNLLAAGAGGAGFGPMGMVAGFGITSAANSAPGRRAISKGANLAADQFGKQGGNAVTGAIRNRLVPGTADTIAGRPQTASAQSLEEALMSQSMPNQSNTNVTTSPMMAPPSMLANTDNNPFNTTESYQNSQQMSSGSPYSRENLLADMQRDPENADKYIAYFQSLDEIFNPQQAEPLKLNNTAIQSITDLQTGLDNLGGLETKIASNGANSPLLGRIRSANPFDTEAKSLRAEIDRVKQVVGKALEGGVLRKEDEEKYARILPTINDTDAVASQKIAAIRSDLQNKLDTFYINQQQFSGSNSLSDALMQYQQPQQQGAY